MRVNGTLVEAKMCTLTLKSTHFTINKCPIYTIEGASAKFSTNYETHNTENSKQIFPGKELCGYSLNSYIQVSVSSLYIPLIGLPILLQENRWAERGNLQIVHRHMNAEIRTEAVQFLFWEYINSNYFAVRITVCRMCR